MCKCSPTHYVECFENAGNGKKRRYFDHCIYLETISDGRIKIQVINGKRGGKQNVRYVNKEKLIEIYVNL
jgi:hypothetical protein